MNAHGKPLTDEQLWGEPSNSEKSSTVADVCSKNPRCQAWWDGMCHAAGGELCQQNKDL